MRLRRRTFVLLSVAVLNSLALAQQEQGAIPGFLDPAAQRRLEERFLAVPDRKMAEEHLRVLTAEPHMAGTPEDRRTAEYVAAQFRAAGLDTEIVEYKVWLPYPKQVSVEVTFPRTVTMRGPTPERVESDPFQADPRVVMPYNGMSPSGEVEAEVVYANYGRPEDFRTLKDLGVEVKGKIVIVRYGENYRGVKSYVAQEHGAAGVLIYSDPMEDGYFRGDIYPRGPWRPESGVQRGSVGYIFEFPGDPTTPGVASLPSVPDSKRIRPEDSAEMPKVPTTPLSARDARPILENLGGPESPRAWQGALPFTYHLGPGPVKVRMRLKHEYALRPIWNVIGVARGGELPDEWVVFGNHRDAWAYGAVDPNSGSATQLEAARGIGALLKSGWRPKRSIVFASWDAEEFGLIGSTEWVEQHAGKLQDAVAYLNADAAVAGGRFGASAVPSLKQFLRDVAKAVPAADGGSVYDAWKRAQEKSGEQEIDAGDRRPAAAAASRDLAVGDLGSGSDYTPFLQHAGVPSTDAGSSGNYGVYHSVFDNFAWFKRFADPDFRYTQQMARFMGVQALRMANADVLPFDYRSYGEEIAEYLRAAQKKAEARFGAGKLQFSAAIAAAERMRDAGSQVAKAQAAVQDDARRLNAALSGAERALLLPAGLPGRPWYRHAIYAPGRYTGYAAVVVPGVNEAIEAGDAELTKQQLAELTRALDGAEAVLRGAVGR